MRLLLLLSVFATGCGDDGMMMSQADAQTADANTNKVRETGCPAAPSATVTTDEAVDDRYMPMTTMIMTNGIVRFVMSGSHDVTPNPIGGSTDPGIVVGSGETKCLQFTQAGTYNFYCSPHGFTGTILVQ